MLNYLQPWIDQVRWQRLIEAVNGNIKLLLRRGRGYKILLYLLLKAQRMAAAKTDCGLQESRLKMRLPSNSCGEPFSFPLRPTLVPLLSGR